LYYLQKFYGEQLIFQRQQISPDFEARNALQMPAFHSLQPNDI